MDVNIDAKDNVTIVNKDDEVIVIITEEGVIIKNGYKVLYDVGVEILDQH